MKKTLLELAQATAYSGKYCERQNIEVTADELELAVAMLHNKISVRQYAQVMGIKKPGSVTQRTTKVLRWGIHHNLIKIELVKKKK